MLVSNDEELGLATPSTADGDARLAEIETFLTAAWSSALRGKALDPALPYWALGINSNRALDILRYIWLNAGLDLHVNIFIEAPTIREMAVRMADHSAFESQPVLPMGGAGGAPALFLLPGGGGFLHEVAELARAFEIPGTIYGVTASGTDGRLPIHDNHYDEAARAAALIQQTQRRGPYNIAGYSLGGCTALETARILRRAGHEVQLMLLDSGLNEHCWPVSVWLRYITPHFVKRVAGRLKKNRAVAEDSARTTLPSLAPPQRGTMFEFRFRNPRHPHYPYHSPHWQSFHPPNYTRMRARAIVMRGLYRPQPYDGPVTFFISRGGDPAACSPRDIWPKYLPNMQWVEASGTHTSMIMGRHARQLADDMTKRLINPAA
jgi:thioesterase domain-containing protein